MNNFVISQIRTYVPIFVGYLASWAVSQGINLDPDTEKNLTLALGALLSGVYYYVARMLERRWPQLGWLLGSGQQPDYKAPTATNKKSLE